MRKGRFGPYVQHGKTVANLPRGVAMEEISLDEAVALLAEKGKALKPRGRGEAAKPASSRQGSTSGEAPAKTGRRQGPRQGSQPRKVAKKAPEEGRAANKPGGGKPAARKAPARAASKISRRAAE